MSFHTAGESHGPGLTVIVEGIPAGLHLDAENINKDLGRRQKGYGRGDRMRIESDQVEILSGIRFRLTLGSPIAMVIRNRDYANWEDRMAPGREPPEGLPSVTVPRPGHADLAGVAKYGFDDIRNVIERASARETAARTAAGAVYRRLLEEFGVRIVSHVIAIGSVRASIGPGSDPDAIAAVTEQSSVRCLDPEAAAAMEAEIDRARREKDTVGGVFEVMAFGLPPGLGSYVSWDRKLDGRLAQALMSVHAIKGVEIGLGFEGAARFGSQVHDPILPIDSGGIGRSSNRAGGLEGGVTNGQPLVLRAAMKPLSTLMEPLPSVDLATLQETAAHVERSDVCAVPAAAVVGEAMCAIILGEAFVEKFGGDALDQMRAAYDHYVAELRDRGLWGG